MSTHIFARGDTFWGLSRRYNTTVAELQRLNPNLNPNSIPVGTIITIREQTTAPQRPAPTPSTFNMSLFNGNDKYGWIIDFYTRLGWRMTSDYGIRVHPKTGKANSFHRGIDFAGKPLNEPIHCPVDGTVLFSDSFSGWGNLVGVQDKLGFIHLFGHLNSRSVRVRDTVKKGDVIGLNGSTGNSTANHLHYQINTPNGRIIGDNAHTDPKMFRYERV